MCLCVGMCAQITCGNRCPWSVDKGAGPSGTALAGIWAILCDAGNQTQFLTKAACARERGGISPAPCTCQCTAARSDCRQGWTSGLETCLIPHLRPASLGADFSHRRPLTPKHSPSKFPSLRTEFSKSCEELPPIKESKYSEC